MDTIEALIQIGRARCRALRRGNEMISRATSVDHAKQIAAAAALALDDEMASAVAELERASSTRSSSPAHY